MLLCSSGLRPPASVGDEEVLRLAAAAGCQGMLVGEGCSLPLAAALVTRAMHAGLPVVAVAGPLGDGASASTGTGTGKGASAGARRKRLPRLAAADRDERAAAIELASRAFALAGSVGASLVVLHMGALPLAVRPADLGLFFRRRELVDDVEGEASLMGAMGERRATVGAALDACRWSLDALTREGERQHVRLALELSATPWGVPSPREGLDLLAGYEGTRLGLVLDPARLSVMRRLGLTISRERHAAVRAAAFLVAENEAVGLDVGYLPGLGERDDDLSDRGGVSAEAHIALIGRPDSTEAELIAAASLAQRPEAWGAFRGPLPRSAG